MLSTPHTTSWELALDIFGYTFRPCRGPQETIYEYNPDGRPRFEWEYLRQLFIIEGRTKILDYCGDCPINVMAEIEGCKCRVYNLDIFFRALNELAPESLWAKLPRDGTPISSHQAAAYLTDLLGLKQQWKDLTWPTAVPKSGGQPYYEEIEELNEAGQVVYRQGEMDFFAWNGEGPPSLLHVNEGYSIYLSRHGLSVKPTAQDPIPYVFRKIWREDMGVFGEELQGEQIGFDILAGRYPTWGPDTDSGTELSYVPLPADQVFAEILDLFEVYSSMAVEFETGFLVTAPTN